MNRLILRMSAKHLHESFEEICGTYNYRVDEPKLTIIADALNIRKRPLSNAYKLSKRQCVRYRRIS